MSNSIKISKAQTTPANLRIQIAKLEAMRPELCDTFAYEHLLKAIEALKEEIKAMQTQPESYFQSVIVADDKKRAEAAFNAKFK